MTRHIHSEWGRRVPTNPELDQTNRHYVSDPGTGWPYVIAQCVTVVAALVAVALVLIV